MVPPGAHHGGSNAGSSGWQRTARRRRFGFSPNPPGQSHAGEHRCMVIPSVLSFAKVRSTISFHLAGVQTVFDTGNFLCSSCTFFAVHLLTKSSENVAKGEKTQNDAIKGKAVCQARNQQRYQTRGRGSGPNSHHPGGVKFGVQKFFATLRRK